LNIVSKEKYEQNAKNIERLYSRFFPKDKNAKFLDCGCGIGHFLYTLRKMGYQKVEGIDKSSEQLLIARKMDLKVWEEDVFKFLSDKINEYDVIIATDILEHFYKDELITFLEMSYKSLKKEEY